MASDTQKAVEIALRLTGIDPKAVKPLTQAFKDLDTGVKNVQKTINTLQTTLNKIKPPASLKNIETSLKSINKIKLKDLSPLAANLSKLSKISNFPNIGNFVNNVQKLSTVSFAGFKALSDQFKALERIKIDSIVNKLRALNTAISALQKQGGLSAFGKFATDISQMKKALELSQGSVDRMTQSLKDVSQAAAGGGVNIRTFGEKFRTVLEFRGISEVIIMAKLAILGARDAIIEYDQALKDLQAITGATDSEVAQMGKTILEVASTTKFSATEVAAGMRTIGQAGFTASDAMQTMQGVSDLATGTLSDMSQVVDLVTTAMKVFNIQASESTKVVDTFANAVNRSKLTITKLRTAMNYVGPVANDANITFQEMSAAMMTLANSGLRASTIGTGLRRVFAELVAPSKKMKEAASEVGIALMDLDPTSNSLASVLGNLGIVLQDTSVAFDLFGKRGAAAAIALTSQDNQYNELLATVSRTGTAAEQAAKQMEGLGVSFKNLQDKLKNLGIALGAGGIATALRVFVDLLRLVVDRLTELSETIVGKAAVSVVTLTTVIIGLTGAFIALQKLLITSGIAAFTAKLVTLTKVALKTGKILSSIFSPIGRIVTVLILLVSALFKELRDGAKTAGREAEELAGKYDNLSKQVDSYLKEVIHLKEGSEALKNVSLGLRQSLQDVANANLELADSAKKAAESIDPLTGRIKEGKEELKAYQEEVNKLQFDNLVTAIDKAGESLTRQGNFLPSYVTRLKDAFDTILVYGKGVWDTWLIALNSNIFNLFDTVDKIGDVWSKALSKAKQRGENIEVVTGLIGMIKEGSMEWEYLQKQINSWDINNLTSQQKKLKEGFDEINNQSIKFINHLRETGKLDLDQSAASFEFFAKKVGFTGAQLKSLMHMFDQMKEKHSNTISSILDKWSKGAPGEFALTKDLEGFEEVYKQFGQTLEEGDKKELQNLDKKQKAYVDLYNRLKYEEVLLREDENTTQEQREAHAQKIMDLENEVSEFTKQMSKNKLVTQIRLYNQITEAHKRSLKENEENDKRSEEQKAKTKIKLLDQYEKDVQKLMQGSAEKIAQDAQLIADGFAEALDSSALTVGEQQNAVQKWFSDVQSNLTDFSQNTDRTLAALSQNLQEAFDLNLDMDSETFTNITESIEQVTSDAAEYYQQMGDNIGKVLDDIASREQTLLDNIEHYAEQALNVQTQVEDFLFGLEQKRMNQREKYDSNRQKALELERQGVELLAEAEKTSGEEAIRLRDEGIQKLEESFNLIKANSNAVKNTNKDEEAIEKSKEKVKGLYKDIASLSASDSNYSKKRMEIEKRIQDEIEKQKELRKDITFAEKAYNEVKAAANKNEDLRTQAYEDQQESTKDMVQSLQDQREVLDGLQQQAYDLAEAYKSFELDIDPEKAITQLHNFQERLKVLSEPQDLEINLSKVNTKPMDDEIVKVGKTWTNVWTKASTDVDKSVKTMKEALNDISTGLKEGLTDQEVPIKFMGYASEAKPLTEKITDIKQLLKNFVEENYDKVIDISLGGFSLLKSQLDTIINKLAEIQDKEVTVKVNYESTGNDTEKRKIGGRIAGYGGGDKHPVLAEGGEWFIRKEAVKKYGDSFFAALNNMAIPKFQMGGKLLETAPSLNSVGNMETNNTVNNWNLTIGTETYAPRGKVKSIAEQLIAEVRGVY